MLVTGGGTGGTADEGACSCAKSLMLDPCDASRDLCCCATCAHNNLSFDLRVSFGRTPTSPMSSLQNDFSFEERCSRRHVLHVHSPFSLGKTTVHAVTLLRGSPVCMMPRPIRESSPHRLHCRMDMVSHSLLKPSRTMGGGRAPVASKSCHSFQSVSRDACMMQARRDSLDNCFL